MSEEASASPAMTSGGGESASVSTPASTPATTSTQTGGSESAATTTPAEGGSSEQTENQSQKQDWKKVAREDADLKAFIEAEANRLAQRQRDRDKRAELRRLAKEAVAASDDTDAANKAFSVAQQIAAETDPDETRVADHHAQAQRVAPMLDLLAADPDYKALYAREGKAKMDARWHDGPIAFAQWASGEVKRIAAQDAAERALKELRKAAATEAETKLLSNVGVPLSGGGLAGGGRLTPESYMQMSTADRLALRKSNPQAIDEMMARMH